MLKGACLCNAISFQFDASAIVLFNRCYCKKCQKASGVGSRSQVQVDSNGFSWISRSSAISEYESTPGNKRPFCCTCGSPLPHFTHEGAFVAIPAGLIDSPLALKPEINMHAASVASWDSVDTSITTISDQGDQEFWANFMQKQSRS